MTNIYTRWGLRGTTAVVWAIAAASVVYWGLRVAGSGTNGPPAAVVTSAAVVDESSISRLLGATATAAVSVAETSRWQLLGVLAGQSSGAGAALIGVDGQPAKPYRVGAQVAEGWVLQSLSAREARLGASLTGPSTLTLSLPVQASAS